MRIKKILFTSIIIIILAVITIFIYWYWQKELLNTKRWQTFQHERWGYEIKYPKKWQLRYQETASLTSADVLIDTNNDGHDDLFITRGYYGFDSAGNPSTSQTEAMERLKGNVMNSNNDNITKMEKNNVFGFYYLNRDANGYYTPQFQAAGEGFTITIYFGLVSPETTKNPQKFAKKLEPYFKKMVSTFRWLDPLEQAGLDTAGWSTFKNEKLKYKIKYPQSWEFNHQDNDNISINSNQAGIYDFTIKTLYPKDNRGNLQDKATILKDWLSNYRRYVNQFYITKIDQSGVQGFYWLTSNQDNDYIPTYNVVGDGFTVVISFRATDQENYKKLKPYFKAMINSFSWLAVDTTDWQTFQNEKWDYQIKHPSTWQFDYQATDNGRVNINTDFEDTLCGIGVGYYQEQYKELNEKKDVIKINHGKTKGYYWSYQNEREGYNLNFYTFNGNYGLVFNCPNLSIEVYEKIKPIFEEIVDSFSWLPVDETKWAMYQGSYEDSNKTEQKFELRYPKSWRFLSGNDLEKTKAELNIASIADFNVLIKYPTDKGHVTTPQTKNKLINWLAEEISRGEYYLEFITPNNIRIFFYLGLTKGAHYLPHYWIAGDAKTADVSQVYTKLEPALTEMVFSFRWIWP